MNLPLGQRPEHIRRVKRVMPFALLLWMGCGSEAPPPAAHPSAPPPAAPAKAPPGAIWREDVVKTVDAGLGRFLQHVEVEPKLDGGVFVGFRIVSLQPAQYWDGIDLEPDDVVLRVNSMPIERDSEAFAAFQTLKTADQLTVLLLRDGEQRELRLRILDRGASPSRKPAGQASSTAQGSRGNAVAPASTAGIGGSPTAP